MVDVQEYPKLNKYQSVVTDKLLEPLDRVSRTDFLIYINEIEFIRNLTSVNRERAKDRPKDEQNKIIVDLVNLHVLEDMSYFTERADFFRKNKVYTDLYPNSAPGSEYRKFWDEERKRCKEGHIRPSDGEWIPGYYYFYLNYCPILKIEEFFEKDKFAGEVDLVMNDLELGVRGDRVEDFPSVWDGDYQFFHYVEQAEVKGAHGSVLKTRGRGYSLKGGGMLSRNYFINKNSKSYAFASETEYLIRDGTLTKAWSNLNFIDNYTPWTQPRDYKDRDMHKTASYRDVDKKTERGFMSEIIGVTCKNDPDKGRGKRGKFLFFDESGIFPGLKKTWQVARKSVEQGRYVYGFMLTAGTGGTEGSNFEAAEAFFYYPDGYNIKSLKNVWDITKVESRCALFVPEYLNRQGCYDENGNSNVIKALIEILIQRQKVRLNSSDPASLIQEKAEAAITPQDSVLRIEGNIFPIQDLKDRLSEISVNLNKFTSSHYIGRLAPTQEGKVKFVYSEEMFPIREYPLKDNLNKLGAVEIYEHPKTLSDGFIPRLRYIAGIDTYDDDHSTTNSLGSIFILDRYSDRIVAEYTGRPHTANEFYEICLRLLKYYNAIANYENDKKGLYGYFYNKNALHYLCDNPEILSEKDLANIKNNYGNKKKGTNSSTAVNAWGRRLQADWLVANAYGTGGTDEEGNEILPLMNLQVVRSVGYIRELIAWHPDLNADRVSSIGMLMILRADMEKMEVRVYEKKAKGIFQDSFFNRTGKVVNSYSYAN